MGADAERALAVEEQGAWREYLEQTREQVVPRYYEVEPWAWSRLQQRLKTIRARRASIKTFARTARAPRQPPDSTSPP